MHARLPLVRQKLRPRWRSGLLACLVASACAAAYAEPAVHTVVIEAMQFSPATLEVHAGDTVIWKNKDPFPHNATADNKAFHSPDIDSGKSWKFVARQRGSFSYICTLHPTMKGTLVVK
jgi:plastocyanin